MEKRTLSNSKATASLKVSGSNPFKTSDWEKVSTFKGDFSVVVPPYHHIKNNDKITGLYNHPELEAYDQNKAAFYQVKRSSLHDFEFIESDDYELNRLIEKFLKELDIDSSEISIDKLAAYPTATAVAESPKK